MRKLLLALLCLAARPAAGQGHAQFFAVLKDTTAATRDTVGKLLRHDGADSALRFGYQMVRFSTPDSVTPKMYGLVARNAWYPFTLAAQADMAVPIDTAHDAFGQIESVSSWGVAAVQADSACLVWKVCGQGTRGGIIDAGSGPHPDLSIVGSFNYDGIGGADSLGTDVIGACGGHGTHTAGTANGRLLAGAMGVGIAPESQIEVFRTVPTYAQGCTSYGSAFTQALLQAVRDHLQVVNASLSFASGGSHAFGLDAAVKAAHDAGLIVVVAAGNDGGPVNSPANAPGAIAVAAWNSNSVDDYSAKGPEILVAAPGDNINSTLPGGGYGTKGGTSMAAPHIAGIVLLIKTVAPNVSPDSMRKLLCVGAKPVASGGCGVPQVMQILRAMMVAGQPTASPVPTVCHVGTTCSGCFDATGNLRDALSSVPWLTVTSIVGQHLCWSASPPVGAVAPTLTLRS